MKSKAKAKPGSTGANPDRATVALARRTSNAAGLHNQAWRVNRAEGKRRAIAASRDAG